MILSETIGHLEGIQYDASTGLTLKASWFGEDPFSAPNELVFPWNRNVPAKVDLNNLRGKKVKITIETIEN